MDAPKEKPDGDQERSLDPENWSEFRALAHRMLDSAIDHIEGVRDRPLWTPIPDETKDALAEQVPMDGQGIDKVCDDALKLVLPHSTGNIHPRFFGWVHGTGTASGIIADTIAAAMNSNLGGRDHGAVYVERQVIDWCRQLFNFPDTASGLVVSGTSMATIIALITARHDKTDYDVRHEGVRPDRGRLVGYTSTETHSCIARAFDYMGLGRDALRLIPVDDDYRMDVSALTRAIEEDLAGGNQPFCVVGSPATVNTGAIDPLDAIADVCDKFDLWYHIDGAFGAVAALSENLKPRFKGIERAHSIALDFHKWMHVQYDAGFVLIRDGDLHRNAFTMRPEYLKAAPRGLAGGNPWFYEFGPELSRGFRALKVWFTLKEHGITRITEKIDDNCNQATYLAAKVDDIPDLELSAPVSLNIVCFRIVSGAKTDQELDTINADIVMDLQEKGIAAPSTTILKGRTAIRINITNHRTTTQDLDILIDAVLTIGRAKL